MLRLGEALEDRRGRHRDAGGHSAPVEGDPDGAREVRLSGLREDQPATGAVPPDAAGMGASASRTMPLKGRSEVSPWAGSHACSQVPSAVEGARRPCTPSSAPPSSTMSVRLPRKRFARRATYPAARAGCPRLGISSGRAGMARKLHKGVSEPWSCCSMSQSVPGTPPVHNRQQLKQALLEYRRRRLV